MGRSVHTAYHLERHGLALKRIRSRPTAPSSISHRHALPLHVCADESLRPRSSHLSTPSLCSHPLPTQPATCLPSLKQSRAPPAPAAARGSVCVRVVPCVCAQDELRVASKREATLSAQLHVTTSQLAESREAERTLRHDAETHARSSLSMRQQAVDAAAQRAALEAQLKRAQEESALSRAVCERVRADAAAEHAALLEAQARTPARDRYRRSRRASLLLEGESYALMSS
eukprot:5293894-Pleurochrysis_carterae.AAC.1